MSFDLVVIGGGAAGLAAAITAARLGASVALVHDGPLGGDCTLTGCVPSKALLGAAARGASFTDATATVRQAVATVTRREVDDIAAQRRITLVPGRARFRSPRAVDGTTLTAERFVIATGSRPMVAPVDGLDLSGYLTTDDVFSLDRRPQRLLCWGRGRPVASWPRRSRASGRGCAWSSSPTGCSPPRSRRPRLSSPTRSPATASMSTPAGERYEPNAGTGTSRSSSTTATASAPIMSWSPPGGFLTRPRSPSTPLGSRPPTDTW